MKHKWWIAGVLLLIELGLCAGMVFASNAGIDQFRQSGLQVHLVQTDTFSAQADEEHRLAVEPQASLVITNDNGTVAVQPGPTNEMIVHVHKTAWGSSPAAAQTALAALDPHIAQSGSTVSVNPDFKQVEVAILGVVPLPTFDLTITVPAGTAVTARTSTGSITLSGLTGDVQARTSDGPIRATGLAGRVSLQTSQGRIAVDGASGSLQARSEQGDIDVTRGSAVDLDLHSNLGSLAFSGSLGRGPHTLVTNLGSIRLNLPSDSALTFDLATRTGQLRSAFPMTETGALNDRHATGSTNGGGARLTATTRNGSIDLDILNP